MNHTQLRAQLIATWPAILEAARRKGFRHDATLPAIPRILGTSTKVRLGEHLSVLTAVAYLSPARESGADMCRFRAGCGCERSCIGTATGLLALPSAKLARLWRTATWLGAPELFKALLHCEVRALAAKAARLGMVPAVRIDGSSDIGLGAELAAVYGMSVRFYDYTKSAERAFASLGTAWHVTLSSTGSNDAQCRAYLAAGGTVARVFAADPKRKGLEGMPRSWLGFAVIDGDASDVRFLDAPGSVVGLRFKRASKRVKNLESAVKSGFVDSKVRRLTVVG